MLSQIAVALLPYGSGEYPNDLNRVEVGERATVRDFRHAALFDLLVLRAGLERLLRTLNRAIERKTAEAA